ncbi:hypothetical protein LTR87_015496 [Friedmanniomyces endolithicus]|nr:hypothetical protein LTR87_015496 [Friedmanniomyces endolithicus]
MDFGGPRGGVDQEDNFDDVIDFNGGIDDPTEDSQGSGNQSEGRWDSEFEINKLNRMTDPTKQQTNSFNSFTPVFNVYGANARNHFALHPQYHTAHGPMSNQLGNHSRNEQNAAAQQNGLANIGCDLHLALPHPKPRATKWRPNIEYTIVPRVRIAGGKTYLSTRRRTARRIGRRPNTSLDPARPHFTPVRPPNDDVAAVKDRMHFYAKHLYDALQIAGVVDLSGYPSMSRSNEQDGGNDIANRFQKQQYEAVEKVRDLMIDSQQIKNARASCILAHDAAVFVHETGVPTKDFEDVAEHPERKSAHYPHIDLVSICSARLEKMIDLVRDFKPIALDMLEGKHMRDFAQDPMYYAGKKQTFLKSNATRAASNAAVKKGKDNVHTEDGAATSSEANGGGETTAGGRSKKRKVTASEVEAEFAEE